MDPSFSECFAAATNFALHQSVLGVRHVCCKEWRFFELERPCTTVLHFARPESKRHKSEDSASPRFQCKVKREEPEAFPAKAPKFRSGWQEERSILNQLC